MARTPTFIAIPFPADRESSQPNDSVDSRGGLQGVHTDSSSLPSQLVLETRTKLVYVRCYYRSSTPAISKDAIKSGAISASGSVNYPSTGSQRAAVNTDAVIFDISSIVRSRNRSTIIDLLELHLPIIYCMNSKQEQKEIRSPVCGRMRKCESKRLIPLTFTESEGAAGCELRFISVSV
ncbi:hypothetical protein CBL_00711 [Carabus blaptoides fortunei]